MIIRSHLNMNRYLSRDDSDRVQSTVKVVDKLFMCYTDKSLGITWLDLIRDFVRRDIHIEKSRFNDIQKSSQVAVNDVLTVPKKVIKSSFAGFHHRGRKIRFQR